MNKQYIFFWSCGKAEGPKRCLSQWFNAPFEVDGIVFPTAEHWMMYWKAVLFEDYTTADKILAAQDPQVVKSLGRQVANFNEYIWSQWRYPIVEEGNYYKFSQNKDICDWLCSTTEHLVEASPYDTIWGIGLGVGNPDCLDENTWKGLNLLGKAIMDVCARLIEERNNGK